MLNELSAFQRSVLDHAIKTKGYGGKAAASCKRYIERAWALKDEMPEVAVFLAITAEEEAASAVFGGLQKKQYEKAGKLSRFKHDHKAGVYPFLRLLGDALSPEGGLEMTLIFDETSGNLNVRVPFTLASGERFYIGPKPPLSLVSTGPDGQKKNYTEDVRSVASEYGIKSVFEYIQNLANERNKMLYASDKGIPTFKNIEDRLQKHTDAALLNLIIYLLIEPYKVQPLAQEALTSYLEILSNIEKREPAIG
jgi:hypothetical protein